MKARRIIQYHTGSCICHAVADIRLFPISLRIALVLIIWTGRLHAQPLELMPVSRGQSDDSINNLGHAVKLVLVNIGISQKANPTDGAYFPKTPGMVQKHYFSAEPFLAFTGLAPTTGFYGYEANSEFFQGHLQLRGFSLEVRNGLLTAAGQLTAPVLLTFSTDASQPALLLWPAGCQAVFESKADADGKIQIKGGKDLLDTFARITDAGSENAVRLLLAVAATKCTNELPVAGLEYACDCEAEQRQQLKEQDELVRSQLEVCASFGKLIQGTGGSSGAASFWQELDEKCQLVTQDRLGIVSYDFSGDAAAREVTRQMAMRDLASAPQIDVGRKALLLSALSANNLETMSGLTNRLAWEKNLAQIVGQLDLARQNLATVANSKAVGEFRYAGNQVPIGRLSFTPPGPTKTQIVAQIEPQIEQLIVQIQQLDLQISHLQTPASFGSPVRPANASYQIPELQRQRAALAAKLEALRQAAQE